MSNLPATVPCSPDPLLAKSERDLLIDIACSLRKQVNTNGFAVPQHDEQAFTYMNGGAADDDRVQTIVYKKNGATVATMTFTYFGTTNNVQSITLA